MKKSKRKMKVHECFVCKKAKHRRELRSIQGREVCLSCYRGE